MKKWWRRDFKKKVVLVEETISIEKGETHFNQKHHV